MYTFLMVIQVLVAVAVIGLVLLQQGKGADAGAAFGSGASSTVFGARGSANFLSRATAILAAVFFCVSLALAYLVHGTSRAPASIVDTMQQQAPAVVTDAPQPAESAPSAPAQPEQAPKIPE